MELLVETQKVLIPLVGTQEPKQQRIAVTPETSRQLHEQTNKGKKKREHKDLTRFDNCLHPRGRMGDRSY